MKLKITFLSLLVVSMVTLPHAGAASALTEAEYTALLTSLEQRVQQLETDVRRAEQARVGEEKAALTARLQALRAETERFRGLRVEAAAVNLTPPTDSNVLPLVQGGSETEPNSGIIITNTNAGRDTPNVVTDTYGKAYDASGVEITDRSAVLATKPATVIDLITRVNLIGSYVIPFLIAIGFLILIFGIVGYIRHGDNEEKRAEGRMFIIWGIVSIFMMLSIWGFVNILVKTFNFDNTLPADSIPVLPLIQ